MRRYHDRHGAGQALAGLLERSVGDPEVIVLTFPCGGGPAGAEVARHVGVPLGVRVVRKLVHAELAPMGGA